MKWSENDVLKKIEKYRENILHQIKQKLAKKHRDQKDRDKLKDRKKGKREKGK
jgi:hypothetical protein